MKEYRAIGLMSGTSLDGVDVALLRTDGEGVILREGFLTVPYVAELRERLRGCFNKAPEDVQEVTRDLTIAHADAVKAFLTAQGLSPQDIDLIGFHGQTIAHVPDEGYTCQIGDGKLLATLTGITTVNDFRTADVKSGGQGAPLAPAYHQALAMGLEKPVVFLNMGGVANVTYVGVDGDVLAFDTGPGNALLDDWVREKTGAAYDKDGALADAGEIDAGVLEKLLAHPYFTALPPKSLDRDDFASDLWAHLSTEDGAATLAAFTVQTIINAAAFLPSMPKQWIASGGGMHNLHIMRELNARLESPVVAIDELGWNGDAIEAEAFAYLAVRSVRGLPISFPRTTGVKEPMCGGICHDVAKDAA